MKINRLNILGVGFSIVDRAQALAAVLRALDEGRTFKIFTPNPEIVMEAYRDAAYMAVLNRGDLVVPDGIGIVVASRLLGRPLPERVAGYDLQQRLFEAVKGSGKTVFFYGAKPGVAEKAAEEMARLHPGLQVAGWHHGYCKDDREALAAIREAEPDIVLVGLGAPRQEKFIVEHASELEGKVLVGVGGSFDVMAGSVQRAPEGWQKLGLEWLYRLLQQPSRIKRMMRLPLFLCKIVIEGKSHLD